MSRRPTNANQAFTQGWRMVCVVPQKEAEPESEVLNFIFRIADEHFFSSFTQLGKTIPKGQLVFWIRGGDWTTPFAQNTLNLARKKAVFRPFVREIERMVAKNREKGMASDTPHNVQAQKDP